MKKSFWIVLGCFLGSVLFLALTSVWRPFCLFASALFLVATGIWCFYNLKDYFLFKQTVAEQRLVDAYLYADQNIGQTPQDFSYDKKTERSLKRVKRNQFSSLFSLIVLFVLGIILLVLSIKITFF